MVRRYKVKGQKRKAKSEKYDRGEDFDEIEEEEVAPKKLKSEGSLTDGNESSNPADDELPGIPIIPVNMNDKQQGIIFILEKASLEIAKVGKDYQLLSSDEHKNYLLKNKRNPAEYRPDIAFQVSVLPFI